MSSLTLYDHPDSGNGHKVRMFLNMLNVPFQTEVMHVHKGENQAEWFKKLNPLTQIPVIRDGEVVVQDSQAILVYLALKHDPDWLGKTPSEVAAVMEWLSFAAKEVCNGLQMARLYYYLDGNTDIDIAQASAKGQKVLIFLESVLSDRDWLARGRPTIADLAVFPYVALAREGRLALNDFAEILRWIDRITALPRYISMRGLPGFTTSEGKEVVEVKL